MKKILVIIGLMMASISAFAASPDKGFYLGASTGPSRTGYITNDEKAGTGFWNVYVTPEWRFTRHWGMRVDVGVSGAINGVGAQGENDTLAGEIGALPYFGWEFDQWHIDVAAGLYARVREPYYGGVPSRLGPSVSFGPSVGARAGLYITPRCDAFIACRFEYSAYDVLAKVSSEYMPNSFAGNMMFSLGLRFRLSR